MISFAEIVEFLFLSFSLSLFFSIYCMWKFLFIYFFFAFSLAWKRLILLRQNMFSNLPIYQWLCAALQREFVESAYRAFSCTLYEPFQMKQREWENTSATVQNISTMQRLLCSVCNKNCTCSSSINSSKVGTKRDVVQSWTNMNIYI